MVAVLRPMPFFLDFETPIAGPVRVAGRMPASFSELRRAGGGLGLLPGPEAPSARGMDETCAMAQTLVEPTEPARRPALVFTPEE